MNCLDYDYELDSWDCTTLIKLVLCAHLHKVGGCLQFAKCLGISCARP